MDNIYQSDIKNHTRLFPNTMFFWGFLGAFLVPFFVGLLYFFHDNFKSPRWCGTPATGAVDQSSTVGSSIHLSSPAFIQVGSIPGARTYSAMAATTSCAFAERISSTSSSCYFVREITLASAHLADLSISPVTALLGRLLLGSSREGRCGAIRICGSPGAGESRSKTELV